MSTVERAAQTSRDDFIRAFVKFRGNAKAVAEATGMKPASVSVRASQLRHKYGLKLPKATRVGGGNKIDAAEVQRLEALLDHELANVE